MHLQHYVIHWWCEVRICRWFIKDVWAITKHNSHTHFRLWRQQWRHGVGARGTLQSFNGRGRCTAGSAWTGSAWTGSSAQSTEVNVVEQGFTSGDSLAHNHHILVGVLLMCVRQNGVTIDVRHRAVVAAPRAVFTTLWGLAQKSTLLCLLCAFTNTKNSNWRRLLLTYNLIGECGKTEASKHISLIDYS